MWQIIIHLHHLKHHKNPGSSIPATVALSISLLQSNVLGCETHKICKVWNQNYTKLHKLIPDQGKLYPQTNCVFHSEEMLSLCMNCHLLMWHDSHISYIQQNTYHLVNNWSNLKPGKPESSSLKIWTSKTSCPCHNPKVTSILPWVILLSLCHVTMMWLATHIEYLAN